MMNVMMKTIMIIMMNNDRKWSQCKWIVMMIINDNGQ